jgi:hypothetical protein
MLVVSENKVQASSMRRLPVTDVGRHAETRTSYVAPETSRGRLKHQAEAWSKSALNKHGDCHTV